MNIWLWLLPETQRLAFWVRIPTVSDVCHRGCAYTVLKTVQRPEVCSAVCGTVHCKEPLGSFDEMRSWTRFGLPSVSKLPRLCRKRRWVIFTHSLTHYKSANYMYVIISPIFPLVSFFMTTYLYSFLLLTTIWKMLCIFLEFTYSNTRLRPLASVSFCLLHLIYLFICF